jgi:ABC-type nitrate/sulfonate/bicarbonate transport system substrate-binding protein
MAVETKEVGMKHLMAAALVAGSICAAQAQDLIAVNVSLGDVSLNKVAFLVAADNGIYEKNGLKVRQFITANAAAGSSEVGSACLQNSWGPMKTRQPRSALAGARP